MWNMSPLPRADLIFDAQNTVEKELIIDYLNSDVPYLTLDRGIIYFGKKERNIKIGSLERR